MKTILFFISFFFLFACNSKGQVHPNSLVKFSDIKLVKASSSSPTFFIKGNSKNAVVSAFGNPDSVATMNWESLAEGVDACYYNGNTVYIDTDKNNLWGFSIVNTNFRISFNNHTINIGDNINTLSSIFPVSYSNRYDDLISIGLTFDNGVPYDYFFRISFNPSTNIITELSIGYP